MSLVRKIHPQRTALFLCDIQERFRDVIFAFPSVIATAKKMVTAGQILGLPLVVTEQYPKALGRTVEELDIKNATMCVEKMKFSMFVPQVAALLEQLQTRSVILFGIESHVCVLQTALDLLEANYNVHVLSDGVSSIHCPEIYVALQRMRDAGAAVTTSESVLFQLLQHAQHEKFKEISKLVKEYAKMSRSNQLLYPPKM